MLHSDGKLADALRFGLPAHKTGKAITHSIIDSKDHFPYMDEKSVFIQAVTRLPKLAEDLVKKAGMTIEDIDMFVPHQANLRINEAFRQKMKIPESKMYNNIQRYGNTTAATIPIAYDEIVEKQLVKFGDTIMFLGLGAGLTWGGVIYKMV